MGEPPLVAAEKGGREVALPVLAATLTTIVVFFPVTLLYGVSKFLFFRAGAGGGALAVRVLRGRDDGGAAVLRAFMHAPPCSRTAARGIGARFNAWFQPRLRRAFWTRIRQLVDVRAGAARAHAGSSSRIGFAASLLPVPAARAFLLPAHRCRPVRDQREGAFGHEADRDGKGDRQAGRPDPAHRHPGTTWA